VPPNVMIEFAAPGTRAYTGAMLVVEVVAMNHLGSKSERTPLTKRLYSPDANALIADLDALVPGDGGMAFCAADTGYRVLKEVTVGSVPEVFDDWPACATVLVTRAGKALQALSPTERFQDEIAQLVGPPPSL
jgi:hypothetical protein